MVNPTGFIQFFIEHISTVWEQTVEHIILTSVSIVLSTITGITTGILLTYYRKMSSPVIGFANVIQTIPSLALLGLLLPFLGIGAIPAIVALFLYALLPIIRNTYTGISDIDENIIEVAQGIGLTDWQILTKIKLPIAVPVIFAGIKTAAIINIGIATLCALIGAGGLGEYIFRGISVNNSYMILSGAIPAAMLALAVNFILGLVQKNIRRTRSLFLFLGAGIFFVIALVIFSKSDFNKKQLVAGFPSEFMEREDGYRGLVSTYDLDLEVKELEIGLMYDAIRNKEVDVISGFSTDGRIKAYNLKTLEDDKNYFPPYHAAPVVRKEVIDNYPQLKKIFDLMHNRISDSAMMEMNFMVDHHKMDIRDVASQFLDKSGFRTDVKRETAPELIIGSKAFTESFILAEILHLMIENYTTLSVDTKLGFGGTKLIFDALIGDEIDLYPEYTGTALLVLLNAGESTQDSLKNKKEQVYDFVKRELQKRYNVIMMPAFGFNNTFAINVRIEMAEQFNLENISDLSGMDQL